MNIQKSIAFGLVLAVLFSACNLLGGNTPSPTEPPSKEDPPGSGVIRGNVFIHEASLMIMESYPVQVAVYISGELPTPCNVFKAEVAEPNENNEIHIEVYSEVESGENCIQVIEPFEERVSIPMVGAADGVYKVFVNGEEIGEFSYPA
ncbi:hypothetical protein ACFLYP_00580 [Chloroflexota bacterium]